jgi:hypothetical protein
MLQQNRQHGSFIGHNARDGKTGMISMQLLRAWPKEEGHESTVSHLRPINQIVPIPTLASIPSF